MWCMRNHCICFYVCCKLESAQKNINKNISKGRLTERLLAQGLLTPNMLNELQKEWSKVN